MGTSASESTTKNSQEMHDSITKLEHLFNTMYSDTFSMMKDTVSNMQKHIWPDKMSDATATRPASAESSRPR